MQKTAAMEPLCAIVKYGSMMADNKKQDVQEPVQRPQSAKIVVLYFWI